MTTFPKSVVDFFAVWGLKPQALGVEPITADQLSGLGVNALWGFRVPHYTMSGHPTKTSTLYIKTSEESDFAAQLGMTGSIANTSSWVRASQFGTMIQVMSDKSKTTQVRTQHYYSSLALPKTFWETAAKRLVIVEDPLDAMILSHKFKIPAIAVRSMFKEATNNAGKPVNEVQGNWSIPKPENIVTPSIDDWNSSSRGSSTIDFSQSEEKVRTQADKLFTTKDANPVGVQYQVNIPEVFYQLIELHRQHNTKLIFLTQFDNLGSIPPKQKSFVKVAQHFRGHNVHPEFLRQIKVVGNLTHHLAEPDTTSKLMKQLKECDEPRMHYPDDPYLLEAVNTLTTLSGKSKAARASITDLATRLVVSLDANGLRAKTPDGQYYYFDRKNAILMPVAIPMASTGGWGQQFNVHLTKRYNLGNNDADLLNWLSNYFVSFDPILETPIQRALYCAPKPGGLHRERKRDQVAIQLTDSTFAHVTDEGWKVVQNSTKDLLFEAESVIPINRKKLTVVNRDANDVKMSMKDCWWYEATKKTHISQPFPGADLDKFRLLVALHYYIAPFLQRWRGTQLPLEIVLGEPGSGKSSLLELRTTILTGEPRLRNAPNDMRDWIASATNTGGLHVTDNVQLTHSEMRNRLSDELCRLITEPNPSVEMRELYTTSSLKQLPVDCTFALTAVRQPFTNGDILQRSLVILLNKHGASEFEMSWVLQQLERFGGREAWLMNQMDFLTRFFFLVNADGGKLWNPRYRAKTRLVNYEQALCMAARVFGITDAETWIPDMLYNLIEDSLIHHDWLLKTFNAFVVDAKRRFGSQKALKHSDGTDRIQYVDDQKHFLFTPNDFASWASSAGQAKMFQDPGRVLEYMLQRPTDLQNILHILPHPEYPNFYMVQL